MKEKSKEIPIKETTPEAFRKIIDYIYKGAQFKLTTDDTDSKGDDKEQDDLISTWEKLEKIVSILHLAHKYQLRALQDLCEENIGQ